MGDPRPALPPGEVVPIRRLRVTPEPQARRRLPGRRVRGVASRRPWPAARRARRPGRRRSRPGRRGRRARWSSSPGTTGSRRRWWTSCPARRWCCTSSTAASRRTRRSSGDEAVQTAWEAAEAAVEGAPPGPTPVVSVPPELAGLRSSSAPGSAGRRVDGAGRRRVDRRLPHPGALRARDALARAVRRAGRPRAGGVP